MRALKRNANAAKATFVVFAILTLAFGMMLGGRAHAQLTRATDERAPAFEVATVKPSRPDGGWMNLSVSPARFQAENAPLAALIRFAYDIKSDDQLPKDPAWIRSERFDIDAKVDDAEAAAMGKMSPEQKLGQLRLMTASLLADRFKLKVSTRTKELPVYALVVAKGGPHLTPTVAAADAHARRMPTLTGGSRGELKAGSVSMTLFSEWLSGRDETGNRVVMDATDLKGSYDFTLHWTREENRPAQNNAAAAGPAPANASLPDSSAPSFITALQEQLGLKLESRKAPVKVLAIDQVELPSPN